MERRGRSFGERRGHRWPLSTPSGAGDCGPRGEEEDRWVEDRSRRSKQEEMIFFKHVLLCPLLVHQPQHGLLLWLSLTFTFSSSSLHITQQTTDMLKLYILSDCSRSFRFSFLMYVVSCAFSLVQAQQQCRFRKNDKIQKLTATNLNWKCPHLSA